MRRNDRAIKAVLFDKDGTLIDFHAAWIAAGLVAARELCAMAKQPSRYQSLVAGAGYERVSKRLDPHSLWAAGTTEALIWHWIEQLDLAGEGGEKLLARIAAQMSARAGRQIVPLADLQVLFAQLAEQELRIGVATMDLEANAHRALKHLGVHAAVDFVCGCDSGHGIKPDSGMVLAFCAHCGLDPHQVMVVGDTPHDMNMARSAGAGMAVALTSGTACAADLLPLADHVLDNLVEMLPLLRDGQALTRRPGQGQNQGQNQGLSHGPALVMDAASQPRSKAAALRDD